ncbi:uncharacterized protein [Fopius arisanus]|uniref:RRM domain-containing protein n=1 Tax=Fopius arisanus TaxID=64838 RepID=A0A9R1TIR9_9HYME|nr:PREDICTED: uncharacterized protein LOC105270593 [Fopius arisanus]
MNTTGDIQLLTITRGRLRPPHLLDKYRGRPANNPNPTPVGVKTMKKGHNDKPRGKRSPINGQSNYKADTKVVKSIDKTVRKSSDSMNTQTVARTEDNLEENLDLNPDDLDESIEVFPSSDLPEELREEMVILLRELLKDLPQAIQKVTMINPPEPSTRSFYVPINSRVSWRMLRNVQVEEVQAFPVVIANIHDICNIEFIMELFGMYEPMLISKMKIIPDTYIRYCWLYFKSPKTAEAVERGFDNGKICGNSLIVKVVEKK